MQVDAALGEPAGTLVCDERRRRDRAGRHELEVDPHVISLDDVPCCTVATDLRRTVRRAHPDNGHADREQEPGCHRVEGARPEDPRGEIDAEAERENRAPAARHTGTGVFSSASATIAAPPSPAERASGPRMRRCESTDCATAFTSSGTR